MKLVVALTLPPPPHKKVAWSNDTMSRKQNAAQTGLVQCDSGECLVYVQWYTHVVTSEYGREYRVSDPPRDKPTVNNFKDLGRMLLLSFVWHIILIVGTKLPLPPPPPPPPLVATKFDDCVHQITGENGSRRSMRRLSKRVQGVGPVVNSYGVVSIWC